MKYESIDIHIVISYKLKQYHSQYKSSKCITNGKVNLTACIAGLFDGFSLSLPGVVHLKPTTILTRESGDVT